jgi:hypothetical protein
MAAYIFSSIALLFSVISFFILLSYIRKRTVIERIPAETREAVAQIINEIDRITDRDSALIEERVAKLKSILQDVDKRIATYEKQIYFELGRQKRFVKNTEEIKPETKPETKPEIVKNDEIADIGKSAAELNAAGIPIEEIAKRLKTSIAEAEVSLFMYQKNK